MHAVSSSPKGPHAEIEGVPAACGAPGACWETLACRRVLCPAYGNRDTDCWLIPKTLCNDYIGDDFFQKLRYCLECPYFIERGKEDVQGWSHFLTAQLQRYNLENLERIYQKEASFVEIMDRLPDGVFTTDQEWRITYFNPAAERITGFSAYDAVGMYCKDVFKNTICETDCALKRAVAEGRDIVNRDYEITNIEGRKIPIICSTSAFKDGAGKITGGLEIFKDVTDMKRLHEELARREKKYSRIFEGSHDMIYTTNLKGDLLDVNQAGVDMLKYPDKQTLMTLTTAADFYRDSRDRERFIALMNRDGFVKDFEVDFKRRDGTPFRVLISSRRYDNPDTGETEYEGIIKDITRRKRAEEILRQRNWELSILNAVAVDLNLTMDLDHILKVTLRNVLRVLKLDRGGIFLIDRDQGRALLQVASGLPEPDQNLTDHVRFKDDLLMHRLIREDVDLTPQPTFPSFRVSYLAGGDEPVPWLHSFLITFKGKGVGFFGLDVPPQRFFSQHEIHLMGSLGNFLGGAIENSKLLRTIGLHRQELRRLTKKLFQSQEEERRRIARELHDETGQALTAVKLSLDRLESNVEAGKGELRADFDEIREMIARTSSEIRRLSYRLHPTLLSDLGLEPALRLYFKEVESRSSLEIHFRMVGFDQRIDPDIETVLYRFSQETLNNTLKHSGAENFRLSIIKGYPMIIFQAEDDGVGFDERNAGENPMSMGLLGMRERVSMLCGTFQIRGRPGEGTRIRIEIPTTEAITCEGTDSDTAGG